MKMGRPRVYQALHIVLFLKISKGLENKSLKLALNIYVTSNIAILGGHVATSAVIYLRC